MKVRNVRDYALDPGEYRSEGAFRVAMQKQQAALPAPTLRVHQPRANKVVPDVGDEEDPERGFYKRRRDRADPAARARHRREEER